MTRRSAISLVEVLIVMAIIAILMAITLPAMLGAKRKSKDITCVSNLKQLHLAVSLYRENWASDGTLGLPTIVPAFSEMTTKLGKEPCSAAPWGPFSLNFPYHLLAHASEPLFGQPSPMGGFEEYYAKHGENAIMIADLNHNPKDAPFMSTKYSFLAHSVTMSGSYKRFKRKGDFLAVTSSFWQDP